MISIVRNESEIRFQVLIVLGLWIASGCTDAEHAMHISSKEASQAASAEVSEILYQCPMHPQITSNEKGECPICGMDLVQVEAAKKSVRHEDHDDHNNHGVKDRIEIHIEQKRIQQLGIRTAPVQYIENPTKSIRGVAKVVIPDEQVTHIHSRVEGWVQDVFVGNVGEEIRAHQVLYSVYSPELVATQSELIAAIEGNNPAAERSAVQRLELWDVDIREIRKIRKTRQVIQNMPFRAPHAAIVHKRMAVQGMALTPALKLYTLIQLDPIWVQVDFLPSAQKPRQGEEVVFDLVQAGEFKGSIDFVYPVLDSKSRSLQTRSTIPNSDLKLRPGDIGTAIVRSRADAAMIVPRTAVIMSDEHRYTFVDLGKGRFQPRILETGALLDQGFVVYDGVEPGEDVVVDANFMLDSESSIRAAIAQFGQSEGHKH